MKAVDDFADNRQKTSVYRNEAAQKLWAVLIDSLGKPCLYQRLIGHVTLVRL
jgi:hypothetical protein